MRWWYSLWKACLASRFISRLRAPLRLCALAIYSGTALAYALSSLASDYEYGAGMRDRQFSHFQKAAELFPFNRDRRSGPAYYTILRGDYTHTDIVAKALKYDPNAADLYFGLAQLRLKEGDQQGYTVALTQLMKLTPGVEYRIVGN